MLKNQNFKYMAHQMASKHFNKQHTNENSNWYTKGHTKLCNKLHT